MTWAGIGLEGKKEFWQHFRFYPRSFRTIGPGKCCDPKWKESYRYKEEYVAVDFRTRRLIA